MKQHECATTKICRVCNLELLIDKFPKVGNRCKSCSKEYLKQWRLSNIDKWRKQTKHQYLKQQDTMKERTKKYRELNPDKCKEAQKKWSIENREHINSKKRERYKTNPKFRESIKTSNNSRHKRLRESMPNWVDKMEIKSFFVKAQEMTDKTGLLHHVDHIIPLRGKNVSGLTVPWNLQVIPESINCRKSNILVDDIVWTHVKA